MRNFLSVPPWPALVATAIALLIALVLVVTQRWHGSLSLDSMKGVQKVHTQPTPRIGGVAVMAGLLSGYLLAQPRLQHLLAPMLVASTPAFVFGLMEDLTKNISVQARLLATMFSGVLGWFFTGLSITDANLYGLDWLLSFTFVSVAFTAFAVSGIANAINIIDGFNGLAVGTVTIILVSFSLLAAGLGDSDLVHLSMILAGGVLGFGLVNWPLGKIFLGDGGAYFIGFSLAWLAVLLLARHTEVSAWAPMLICGYPILEVFFSISRRRRHGVHMGDADCLHLHSLVKRRVVRALLPNATPLMSNSVTGATMWMAAVLPATIAVHWPTHTPTLVLGFVVCALLYWAVYARIIQFHWFFSPHRLESRQSA